MINGVEDKYPKVLLENREILEGNVFGLLWENLELLEIYDDLKEEMFLTLDGRFYFRLIRDLKAQGYKSIDDITLKTYFSNNSEKEQYFKLKGGSKALNNLSSLLQEVNLPKYYDDLLKSNIYLELHALGFNVVQNLDKFKDMKANDIYSYYDLLLNNLFVEKTLDLETADLTSNYESYIDRANSGQTMGISYKKASPIMNYQTCGVRKGCTIVSSTTSGGKSSWLAHHYILNFIEQGHRCILIINEEDEDAWRSLILTTVINTKVRKWDNEKKEFNYKGMSRKRFLQGSFTQEELNLIKMATEWLAQYPKSIEFIKCFDYRIETVKKIVGKYSKLGYDVCMLDTFKAPEGGSDNNPAWKLMSDGAKALFHATAKEGMYLVITAQVALRYSDVRTLNCSHLGGATAISEIADTVIIFRDAWEDEKDMGKPAKYLKPYNHMKDNNGNWLKSTTEEPINIDKKYAVATLAKVRAGEIGTTILYEKNIAFNHWHEVGYCKVSQY